MSNGQGKRSDGALAAPETASVFDFLYQDRERIAAFLAQLDPNGVLQSYKRSIQAGQIRGSKTNLAGSGSIGVAKASATSEESEGEDSREAAEHTYDPAWSNALSLLDLLAGRAMIKRDVTDGSIGQVVLVQGDLSVLDVAMLRGAWELPSVRASILSSVQQEEQHTGNRHQRRGAERRGPGPAPAATDPLTLALDLLGLLPHSVQARLEALHQTIWCNLKPEGLVTSSSDLTLKHGVQIPGTWNMLGIIDARPDILTAEVEVTSELVNGIAAMMVAALAPATRLTLGRPGHAYGMTPLLIFREISA